MNRLSSLATTTALMLVPLAALASPLLRIHELKPNSGAIPAVVNCVTKLAFSVNAGGGDPVLDSEIDALLTEPGGQEMRVPTFWAGGDRWKVRYAPRLPGCHAFRLAVGKGPAKLAGELSGTHDAAAYAGDNRLLQHGPVQLAANAPYRSTFYQKFDDQGRALAQPLQVALTLPPPFAAAALAQQEE